MKGIFLLMGFLLGFNSAYAEQIEALEGKYFNPAYDGEYNKAWVEIRKGELGGYELIFNVPCGTKYTPQVFKIINTSEFHGNLELIEDGGGVCYTGQNPRFSLSGNSLSIYTDLKIRVPGFYGVYKFKK